MNKLIYISPLLLLTACSKGGDEVAVPQPVDSTIPISLSAADSIVTTRADMKGIHTTGPWLNGDIFQVNAYYYYSTTTNLAQSFIQAQPVTAQVTTNNWDNTSSTRWSYSPIKYWPQQGYVDFFATFPQVYVKNNLDRQRFFHENLGDTILQTRFYLDKRKDPVITALPENKQFYYTDSKGTHKVVNDTTYHDAEEQWDLMFSHRPHLSKPDVASPVKFLFSHAEMAVRFRTYSVYDGNLSSLIIKRISLNNIHTGGLITATDITDWQSYHSQFSGQSPSSDDTPVSTVGATTPVKLKYDWTWYGKNYDEDIRDTYTQTMDFVWVGTDPTTGKYGTRPQGTQINPGNKVFIIPPQCLGEEGISITVEYTTCDLGSVFAYRTATFTVNACGEPGKVIDIYLKIGQVPTTSEYPIEVVTATLTPWESISGSLITDLEK